MQNTSEKRMARLAADMIAAASIFDPVVCKVDTNPESMPFINEKGASSRVTVLLRTAGTDGMVTLFVSRDGASIGGLLGSDNWWAHQFRYANVEFLDCMLLDADYVLTVCTDTLVKTGLDLTGVVELASSSRGYLPASEVLEALFETNVFTPEEIIDELIDAHRFRFIPPALNPSWLQA